MGDNKAYELGIQVIGIRLHRDENHKVPQPLIDHGAKIMNWDLDELSKKTKG